jgi:hypothetical protein
MACFLLNSIRMQFVCQAVPLRGQLGSEGTRNADEE